MQEWRWIGWSVGLWLMACAASPKEPQSVAPARARRARAVAPANAAPARELSEVAALSPSARAERQERQVAVKGIEGTLSNFDVRVTMEKYGREFGRCHEPRARSVPVLAGTVEFKIHVLVSGEVSGVHVQASDVGDRVLERCLSQVIQAAKFPEPHGGEADVTWNMLLAPGRHQREPEQWQTERIERVLRKHRSELLEICDAKRSGPFTVTAYVSKRGRVLAAGVAAKRVSPPEQFDCIANELRSWPMPRPRKGIAKVSFPLRAGA